MRLADNEYALVMAAAERSGLSVAGYMAVAAIKLAREATPSV